MSSEIPSGVSELHRSAIQTMPQAFSSNDERSAYEALASEMKRGFRVDALWIKAMVEAGNDKSEAANLYARWRVAEIQKDLQERRRTEADRIAHERETARKRTEAQREEFVTRFPLVEECEGDVREQLFRVWLSGQDISERYAALRVADDDSRGGPSVRSVIVAIVLFAVAVVVTTMVMNS